MSSPQAAEKCRFLAPNRVGMCVATHPQKPALKTAAFEVCLELTLNIRRQFRAMCRQLGLERGIVFLDKLV